MLLSVLLLISTVMVFTALYHFYYKLPVQTTLPAVAKIVLKDTIANSILPPDSFVNSLASANRVVEGYIDSARRNTDSLKSDLDAKLDDFYRLRSEIKMLFEDSAASAGTMAGNQRIRELQEKIAALRFINMDVERENKRLSALLNQLKKEKQENKPQPLNDRVSNITTTNKEESTPVFLLYDLKFSAIQVKDGQEQETNKWEQTEKLAGIFKLKNHSIVNTEAEIMVVVLQPDGTVMQQSAWETGTFDTPDGKKVYSKKIRFEYNKGEPKQLRFSLDAEKYERGNYILKIYHKGRLIGKINKVLD